MKLLDYSFKRVPVSYVEEIFPKCRHSLIRTKGKNNDPRAYH